MRQSFVIGLCLVFTLACSGVDSAEKNDGASPAARDIEKQVLTEAVVSDVRTAVASHVSAKVARLPGWSGAKLGHHAVAIFEPDQAAPAFYEIPITAASEGSHGYVVVRATAPFEVVQYNDHGEGPAAAMGRDSRVKRVYRLDAALYVGEDERGVLVDRTRPFRVVDRSGAIAEHRVFTWTETKARFGDVRAKLENKAKSLRTQGYWTDYFGGPPAAVCTVPGVVPAYNQIGGGDGPNTSSCMSGCGPTAWAMILGWGSLRASEDDAYAGYRGLVREGHDLWGTPMVAPAGHDGTASDLMWSINRATGTFCLGDQGATYFPWMASVADYIAPRAPSVGVDVDYNSLSIPMPYIRDEAIGAICDGRPAIIGLGNYFETNMHYPVAWAYDTGWFYLNMGWGGAGDSWYTASTWFFGSVHLQ